LLSDRIRTFFLAYRVEVFVNIDEVAQWRPFTDEDGSIWDLSFLDAHEVTYIHTAPGKPDVVYTFTVSYSFHCFCKDYSEQSEEDKSALMYHAGKDSRPFCKIRYSLAREKLRAIIEGLGNAKVIHAGYGSYAVVEITVNEGESEFYFVPFKVYRERKKLRLHVTSAYPINERPAGKPVSFFKIAHNLLRGRPLPRPQM
jgi:hypothetical protein